MNVLAIDVGTTSMRGILFNGGGKIVSSASHATPLLFIGPLIEQSPAVYTDTLLHLCKEISKDHTVDAITLTAFRSAPALVDMEGNALTNFVMWQDKRNRAICDALSPFDDAVYATCGASVNTVFTAGKISWFRQNMPEIYQSAHKAMIVPDFMICFMTGAFVTDYTYGSRTSLMDLRSLSWDKGMCELFHVDMDKLCGLIPQGSIAGYTTKPFSKLSGIREGVPVISAGGDQQCGALGLGVLDSSALEVNSGTGSFIISVIDEPILGNKSVICNVAAIPGKYTVESNVLSSASALNWLMRTSFPDLVMQGGDPDFEAFNHLAEMAPPGANGLLCVPHFQGCGTRKWDPSAKAGLWGFTLATTRCDLARGLYEGIAAEITKSVAALPKACHQAREVYIAGGLTRGDIFDRILCDMLGLNLIRYENEQATAIGAFTSAAVTLGLFPDYAAAIAAARSADRIERYTPRSEVVNMYQGYKAATEALFQCANQSGAQMGAM